MWLWYIRKLSTNQIDFTSQQLFIHFSSSPAVRFLYDVVSLCEWEAVTLLTVINSCIFRLNSTDCESEVSSRSTSTETTWNSRLATCSRVDQEFWRFSILLEVPVEACANTWTGFTSDRDSLTWSSRLRSRSLSQDFFSWWTWNYEKEKNYWKKIQKEEDNFFHTENR